MPKMNSWWETTELSGAALDADQLNVDAAQTGYDPTERLWLQNDAAVAKARRRADADGSSAALRGWPYL